MCENQVPNMWSSPNECQILQDVMIFHFRKWHQINYPHLKKIKVGQIWFNLLMTTLECLEVNENQFNNLSKKKKWKILCPTQHQCKVPPLILRKFQVKNWWDYTRVSTVLCWALWIFKLIIIKVYVVVILLNNIDNMKIIQ